VPGTPIVLLLSGLVALVLLLPEAALVAQAGDAGWSEVRRVLLRRLSLDLVVNTVELTAVVGAATGALGTAAAWCVERTTLPGRRLWAVLVLLPVAIPDFVVGWSWHALFPSMTGLWAAALVMTLDLYPLVYLPVAAALRRTDPSLEEAARSLGLSRPATFRRVVLPQVRPAVLGGVLVVALALLAEFGAFEILSFQGFSTEVFAEFRVDQSAAAALALLLLVLGVLVLVGEARLTGRGRLTRSGPQSARPPRRQALGRWVVPVTVAFAVVVGLGVGVPVATLIYWLVQSHSSTLTSSADLTSATMATVRYSAAAAAVATAASIPVAMLGAQTRSRFGQVLERSTYLVQSVPGVVVALTLVYLAVRWTPSVYQTGWLLVLAYALLFFPLALVCVRASVRQTSPQLAEVARSLGRPPWQVFLRVTLPIIAPGVLAGFCLVFLSAVTELTATLMLVPTGVQTLATEFWAFQTNQAYAEAAPYALLTVVLAGLPSLALSLLYARRRGLSPLAGG
jgi:iron(III) transport system permease protein